MGVPRPVAGYPSKTDAILALAIEGKMPLEIAGIIGSTAASVSEQMRLMRKAGKLPPSTRGKKPAPPIGAEPGQWIGEKRDKVSRLFGKTMIMIAEAVDVPPAELLKYVLHGVIPPSQKIAELDDIGWRDDAPALAGAVPALPAPASVTFTPPLSSMAPETQDALQALAEAAAAQLAIDADQEEQEQIEPSRDDDEAELARLEAEESPGGDDFGVRDPEEEFEEADEVEDDAQSLQPTPTPVHAIAAEADDVPDIEAMIAAPSMSQEADAKVARRMLEMDVMNRHGQVANIAELTDEVLQHLLSEPVKILELAPERVPTYRLQNSGGGWLKKDLVGYTYRLPDAWLGTGADIERIGKMNRRFLELEPMRA